MKTLDDFNFKNKVVLLRADLNSDFHKGKIIPSERIKESAKTILELKTKGAKVIILAHQGRKGEEDFISLKQHAKFLSKYTLVKFVEDIIGQKAIAAISLLKNGEAILLDNVRFLQDEFNPKKGKKNELFKLVELSDVYVNDAFSVCHRQESSIVLFPKYLKGFAGRLLEKEINALKQIKMKNSIYILGGAKPEDNMKLLNKGKVLACGLFGQICSIANGKNLGAQNEYLRKSIKNYDLIIKKLKKKLKNVEIPDDFAIKVEKYISQSSGIRKELDIEDFPSKYEIFDIGKKTLKKYIEEIKKAPSIFMKGPAGFSADKMFAKGTVELLEAISKSKGFSLVGGGHLSDTIKKYNLSGFNYISLSGGALLRYVAGKKLPGLEALEN